jgi:hypothetical protein
MANTTARKPAAAKPAAAKPAAPIYSNISEGRQTTTLNQVVEIEGHKVRVEIKRDNSYAFQSSANVEVWSNATLSWNRVHHIPHGSMETNKTRGSAIYAFEKDLNALLEVAAKILKA